MIALLRVVLVSSPPPPAPAVVVAKAFAFSSRFLPLNNKLYLLRHRERLLCPADWLLERIVSIAPLPALHRSGVLLVARAVHARNSRDTTATTAKTLFSRWQNREHFFISLPLLSSFTPSLFTSLFGHSGGCTSSDSLTLPVSVVVFECWLIFD